MILYSVFVIKFLGSDKGSKCVHLRFIDCRFYTIFLFYSNDLTEGDPSLSEDLPSSFWLVVFQIPFFGSIQISGSFIEQKHNLRSNLSSLL